ncbi:DNA methyltransferase [Bacilli bacterium]|nr:DNA methyltransferase [Bacilli bacterium]GHU45748.1 DNA methyltransferase [Bacilli bacterium]
MKPAIKYRGGKSKEIPEYVGLIPDFDRYFEPFFGGGATYFYLEPQNAVIGDINEQLIQFYQGVASEKFKVIKRELKFLQEKYEQNRLIFMENKMKNPKEHAVDPNDELYYNIRGMFNGKIPSKYEKATLYFFINKTAYSGMVRYNKNGEFNVPYGRYAQFNTDLLTDQHHKLLSTAEIMNETYQKSFSLATERDFIFLDPPYDTVFSEYGNESFTGDFGVDEHRALAQDFKNLSAPALMIIGDTPLISEIYEGYVQGSYDKNYSVNIRNRFKSRASHLVIANYNIHNLEVKHG